MGRKSKNSVAETREIMEGLFGGMDQEKLKEEVLRLLKQKQTALDDKKDQAKAASSLIKELDEKIDYLVGRVDVIKHEAAVEEALKRD